MTPDPMDDERSAMDAQSRWVRKTPDRLQAQILEQLTFLRSSARLYDEGHLAEAKRIAATTRVLVHNTRQSQALLKLTGDLDRWSFLSTNGPVVGPDNAIPEQSLVLWFIDQSGVRYTPPLDHGPVLPDRRTVPFTKWWGMNVVRDDRNERLTRKDIVLALANKEGGAHVDAKSERRMDRLASSESLAAKFSVSGGEQQWIEGNPLLGSMRQIGWEIERTLARYTGL